jgi:hypothetical protein
MGMKRGQSALEYLVTYGWAILVIVIIAALLAYFGVFNPSRYVSEKQASGFVAFGVTDWNILASTDDLTIKLTNNGANKVTISSVVLNGTASGNATASPTSISPGETTTVTSDGAIFTGAVGDSYDVTVSITYTDTKSGLAHTETGKLMGKVE